MRISIFLAALVAIAAAAPYAQNELPTPTLPVIPSTSLNIPVTSALLPTLLPTGLFPANSSISSTSKKRGGHSEPIPIFSKSCDCPLLATVAYPCYATDALASCNFEENHSWVCWTSANFGCPSPTRAVCTSDLNTCVHSLTFVWCSNLFKPTPITGKHPCELGPHALPTITAAAQWY